MIWADNLWTYIDGEHSGRGVDITQLEADRFMNVLETFMVNELISVTPEDQKADRRDKVRAEILRYNGKAGSSGSGNDYPTSDTYLEPTSDGYYPGLEDGLLGG